MRDHGGNSQHDDFEHRFNIFDEADLQTAGDYYVEAWYIVRDDVDLFNSMGNAPMSPSFSGSSWTFGPEQDHANGSILDRFVDPISPPPGAATVSLDTGEGWVQVAVETTDLGGGQFHYEYAVMNFDFDPQVKSFSVPLGPGMNVSNVEFIDVDADAGNDWANVVGSNSITWQAPVGNALDWGTLYSFAFDVDSAPVTATATLEILEPGAPQTLSTLAPAAGAKLPLFGSRRWIALSTLMLVIVGVVSITLPGRMFVRQP